MNTPASPLDKFVYFAAIDRVASFPEVVTAVRVAVAEKLATPATVAKAIERDVAFSSRLLRIVNAPEIGLIRPCVSVAHAVSLVGMGRIGMLAEATASRTSIEKCAAIAPEVARKAATHASIARVLAIAVGMPPEQAFTAALLCDVGEVAILATYPGHTSQHMTDIEDRFIVEREFFGFDHAELGGEILGRWNLPAPLPEVVAYHHDLAGAQEKCAKDVVRLIALLQATEILAKRVAEQDSITEDALADFSGHPAVPVLGLTAEKIVSLWNNLRASFAREQRSLDSLDSDDADESSDDVVTFDGPAPSLRVPESKKRGAGGRAPKRTGSRRGVVIAALAAFAIAIPATAFALFFH